MRLGKTFYPKNRREWRAWLAKHHKAAPEIWVVYYKKQSGKPRIPYNHAVEGALCFRRRMALGRSAYVAPPLLP